MANSKADAPFVFEGSVKSLSASNVSAVPADDRAVIVQVDHVRQAPGALAGFAGREITVRLAPNEKLTAGDQAIFFTEGLVYADHLAVQSLGHDPLIAVETRAALAGVGPVVQNLRRRIDQAQTVVSGRVSEVRAVKPLRVSAVAAHSTTLPEERISEHEPFWNEAVVDVSAVHKGPKQKTVVVRFPTSTDVRWRNAPKFKKGDKGTWLLHTALHTASAKAAKFRLAAAQPAKGVYTALDPNDFHPASETPALQAMLSTPLSPAGAAKATAKKAVKKTAIKKAAAKKASAKATAKKRRS
jgi:hypothetical protein